MLAQAAGLPGTYLAWLSDNTGSPSTRMTKATVPYVLPSGTQVAANWNDLIDGTLQAPINQTETGGAVPQSNVGCPQGNKPVWSNTNINGTQNGGNSSCSNWTSTNGGSMWGRTNAMDSTWTSWCVGGICSWVAPIYCVQQ